MQLITQGDFSYFSSFKQDLPSPQIVTIEKNMLSTGRLVREVKVRHVYEHERLKQWLKTEISDDRTSFQLPTIKHYRSYYP